MVFAVRWGRQFLPPQMPIETLSTGLVPTVHAILLAGVVRRDRCGESRINACIVNVFKREPGSKPKVARSKIEKARRVQLLSFLAFLSVSVVGFAEKQFHVAEHLRTAFELPPLHARGKVVLHMNPVTAGWEKQKPAISPQMYSCEWYRASEGDVLNLAGASGVLIVHRDFYELPNGRRSQFFRYWQRGEMPLLPGSSYWCDSLRTELLVLFPPAYVTFRSAPDGSVMLPDVAEVKQEDGFTKTVLVTRREDYRPQRDYLWEALKVVAEDHEGKIRELKTCERFVSTTTTMTGVIYEIHIDEYSQTIPNCPVRVRATLYDYVPPGVPISPAAKENLGRDWSRRYELSFEEVTPLPPQFDLSKTVAEMTKGMPQKGQKLQPRDRRRSSPYAGPARPLEPRLRQQRFIWAGMGLALAFILAGGGWGLWLRASRLAKPTQ